MASRIDDLISKMSGMNIAPSVSRTERRPETGSKPLDRRDIYQGIVNTMAAQKKNIPSRTTPIVATSTPQPPSVSRSTTTSRLGGETDPDESRGNLVSFRTVKDPERYRAGMGISPPLLKNMVDFFNSSSDLEVELSFGVYVKDRFIPGVTITQYSSLLNRLIDEFSDYRVQTRDRVEIVSSSRRAEGAATEQEYNVRRITNLETDEVIIQRKTRQRNDIVNDKLWGIRLSRSLERGTNLAAEGIKSLIPEVIRIRERDSFTPNKGRLFGVRFDLSRVRSLNITRVERQSTPNYDVVLEAVRGQEPPVVWGEIDTNSFWVERSNTITYEVEIERVVRTGKIGKAGITGKILFNAIEYALVGLQSPPQNDLLISQQERRYAISRHNSILGLNRNERIPFDHFIKGYWNKPKNITTHDILFQPYNYWVTQKYDGIRKSLFIDTHQLYLIDPPYDITKFAVSEGDETFSHSGSILDGEYIPISTLFTSLTYCFIMQSMLEIITLKRDSL